MSRSNFFSWIAWLFLYPLYIVRKTFCENKMNLEELLYKYYFICSFATVSFPIFSNIAQKKWNKKSYDINISVWMFVVKLSIILQFSDRHLTLIQWMGEYTICLLQHTVLQYPVTSNIETNNNNPSLRCSELRTKDYRLRLMTFE